MSFCLFVKVQRHYLDGQNHTTRQPKPKGCRFVSNVHKQTLHFYTT